MAKFTTAAKWKLRSPDWRDPYRSHQLCWECLCISVWVVNLRNYLVPLISKPAIARERSDSLNNCRIFVAIATLQDQQRQL